MRKILDLVAVISLVLSGTMVGGTLFGYMYLTSEKGQNQIKELVMNQVKDQLPGLVGGAMPSMTGKALPIGGKSGTPKGLPFGGR